MEAESEKPPPQSQYTMLAGFGKTKIITNDTQATLPDSTPQSTNNNILKETLSSKTDSKSWRPALFCPAVCLPWTAMATATGLNIDFIRILVPRAGRPSRSTSNQDKSSQVGLKSRNTQVPKQA